MSGLLLALEWVCLVQTSVLDDLAYLLLGLDQHMRNRDKDGIKMRGPTNRATSLAQQHIQHQHRATDDKVGTHLVSVESVREG